jgi:hypothetical protein
MLLVSVLAAPVPVEPELLGLLVEPEPVELVPLELPLLDPLVEEELVELVLLDDVLEVLELDDPLESPPLVAPLASLVLSSFPLSVLSVELVLEPLLLEPELLPPDVAPAVELKVVCDCSTVDAIVVAWEMISARTTGFSGVVVATCTGAVTVTWPVVGFTSTLTVTTTS